MKISLIEVPYHAGDDRHGASAGPRRLREAGAVELLEGQGHRVSIESADRDAVFRDTAASSAAVNRSVAALVRAAVAAGRLPLVLAGSCITCQGVLAGCEHARSGAVWIDAHADFNTPETTASGFLPGMSLAVVTGHCFRNYWSQIGDSTPLAEEHVALFGVRDLSPDAERQRLERSAIEVVAWRDGAPQGSIAEALERIAGRVDDIYLHLDLDGFAPELAPGIVDEPVPGGLSLAQAETIIRGAAARRPIAAATLATFDPEHDDGERTERLALALIRLIGDCAGQPGGRNSERGG
jgi:arginase